MKHELVMPVRLHINVDHVATIRNARGTAYPDPVFAAQLCEQAGADWLPFEPLGSFKTATKGRRSNEVIWTRD